MPNHMRRTPIKLVNYSSRVADILRLRTDLLHQMKDILFSVDSLEELEFEVLKHLHPINTVVLKNNKSYLLKGKIALYDFFYGAKTQHKRAISTREKLNLFERDLWPFDKLPKAQLRLLKKNVETHLKESNDLIKHYEGLAIVQDFLKKRSVKKNHEAKTILDFYIRCLAERQEILNYYLHGVRDRAIVKSYKKLIPVSIADIFESFKDYPYYTSLKNNVYTIDYRKIDCVSHRLIDVYNIDYLKNLYTKDKTKFYHKYFRHRTSKEIFNNIFIHLDVLPNLNNRKPIFEELEKLYKKKNKMAFNALAFSQIEGLFGDMNHTLEKSKLDSLSVKVKSLRPHYHFSTHHFDYFEYVLPEIRNSYAHVGNFTNDKIQAYDFLTDLEYLLHTFARINSPIVQLYSIIKIRKREIFTDIAFVNHYVQQKLTSSKKILNSEETIRLIYEFENIFLKQECNISYLISASIANLPQIVSSLFNIMSTHFKIPKLQKKFGEFNEPRLKKLFKNESLLLEIHQVFDDHSKKFDELRNIQYCVDTTINELFEKKEQEVFTSDIEIYSGYKKLIKWLLDLESLVTNLIMQ